jgi:hypothetical protein
MSAKKTDKRNDALRGAIGRGLGVAYINKSEFAKKINVTPRTMLNWKNHPDTISLGYLRILARELHFTDEEILSIVK